VCQDFRNLHRAQVPVCEVASSGDILTATEDYGIILGKCMPLGIVKTCGDAGSM